MHRPTDVLTCYRARRRLGAHLDGALSEADARWLGPHVDGCAGCRAEIEQLRRVKALVADAGTVPEPDWSGFFPGIVRGIQDGRDRAPAPAPRRGRLRWPGWAMGGVAVAAAAFTLVFWPGARGPAPAEAGVLVTSAESDHPGATVMVYAPAARDMAVVWVFDTD